MKNIEPIVLKLAKEDLSYHNIKYQIRSKLEYGENRPIKIFIDDLSEQTIKTLASIKKSLEIDNIFIENIYYTFNEEYIYDNKQLSLLKKISSLCDEVGLNLGLKLGSNPNNEGSVKNFFISKKIIENFANEVKNFEKIEYGEKIPLSPLEKFAIIYRFATKHYYRKSNDFHNNDMRSWIGALSSGYMICSGFSSLLKVLCDLVFDKEELQCFCQSSTDFSKSGENLGRHANNYIYINDQKYGYRGFYFNDSCLDCKDFFEDGKFDHFMLTPERYNSQKDEITVFDGNEIVHIISQLQHNPENFLFVDNNSKILDFFGYKSIENIKNEYGDYRQQADSEIKNLEKERLNYINNCYYNIINRYGKNKHFIDFYLLPKPKILNKELLNMHPVLQKINILMQKATLDNLNEIYDEKLFKEYKDFVKKHPELFGDEKIIDEILYIISLQKFPEIDYSQRCDYHKKEIKKIYNNQILKLAHEHEELFSPKEISEEDLQQCLSAVAQFEKLRGKTAEKFVKTQIKSRRNFMLENFTSAKQQEYEIHLTEDYDFFE